MGGGFGGNRIGMRGRTTVSGLAGLLIFALFFLFIIFIIALTNPLAWIFMIVCVVVFGFLIYTYMKQPRGQMGGMGGMGGNNMGGGFGGQGFGGQGFGGQGPQGGMPPQQPGNPPQM